MAMCWLATKKFEMLLSSVSTSYKWFVFTVWLCTHVQCTVYTVEETNIKCAMSIEYCEKTTMKLLQKNEANVHLEVQYMNKCKHK